MEKRSSNWKIKLKTRSKFAKEKLSKLKRSRKLNSLKLPMKTIKQINSKIQRSKIKRIPKKNATIGIGLALIRLIFKSRKRRSRKRRNKSNRKLIRFCWINSWKRKCRSNSMMFMLKRLMFRSKKTSLINLPKKRKTEEKKKRPKRTTSNECNIKSFRKKKEESKMSYKRKKNKMIL
jgi:hypothetical protein